MGVKRLNKKLSQLKVSNWQFKHYPNENHFSTALPAIQDGLAFLFKGFYLDSYQLSAHQDYQEVLADFINKKQSYNGFRVEWLQAYKFSKYIFGSKQTKDIDDILAQVKQQLPDSLVMITNYLKGLNATKQHQDKAMSLANKYQLPMWQTWEMK